MDICEHIQNYFMKFDLGYALLGQIIFTIKLLSLSANFSGDEHLMLAKHQNLIHI
jgi:hypothetical protein